MFQLWILNDHWRMSGFFPSYSDAREFVSSISNYDLKDWKVVKVQCWQS